MFAPTSINLSELFRDPRMFDSARGWRKAGFVVHGEGTKSDVMVASHPSTPGYLFKKYSKKMSPKDQLRNYRRRIEGADKLRAFIATQQLTRIVVPGKHLHELSREFSRKGKSSFVLVVEQIPLLDSSQSKQLYHQIDDETLRQLCLVLRKFRGLDSGVRNVPFTVDGQIAFVDTERWDAEKDVPLRRIREYLSDEKKKLAKVFFKTGRHRDHHTDAERRDKRRARRAERHTERRTDRPVLARRR